MIEGTIKEIEELYISENMAQLQKGTKGLFDKVAGATESPPDSICDPFYR